MSGRPISFEYELYETRIPPRPHVSDDPRDLDKPSNDPEFRTTVATIAHELRTPLTPIRGFADLLAQGALGALSEPQREAIHSIRNNATRVMSLVEDLLNMARLRDKGSDITLITYRSGPLGDLKVSGSYFMPVLMANAELANLTYPVSTPISVRRGQSAMVPLLDAVVSYEPLCVYNPAKMLNHPLLVWRLHNTTGVALEQGPITLMQDGQYIGEGLMRFTGVDEEIQIPYALEFGILVTEEHTYVTQPVWQVVVDRERRRLVAYTGQVDQTIYTLSNRLRHDEQVLIEWRDPVRGDYFEMPPPDAMADNHTRWSVLVPAGAQTTFMVQIREVQTRYREVLDWKLTELDELQRTGIISSTLSAALTRIRQLADHVHALQEQATALTNEHEQIAERQEQLRKNLAALGNSDREIALRNQLLDDLEASEQRRREVEHELRSRQQQGERAQTEQHMQINELFA